MLFFVYLISFSLAIENVNISCPYKYNNTFVKHNFSLNIQSVIHNVPGGPDKPMFASVLPIWKRETLLNQIQLFWIQRLWLIWADACVKYLI